VHLAVSTMTKVSYDIGINEVKVLAFNSSFEEEFIFVDSDMECTHNLP
jgi:hypothetical protein